MKFKLWKVFKLILKDGHKMNLKIKDKMKNLLKKLEIKNQKHNYNHSKILKHL